MGIATQYYGDPFVEDKCVWVARLSNELLVYQDDDRPGESEPNAWKRLKSYIVANSLGVLNIGIKFRSHEIWPLAEGYPGYYYASGLIAGPGLPTIVTKTIGAVGAVSYYVEIYRVPELFLLDTDVRMIPLDDEFIV